MRHIPTIKQGGGVGVWGGGPTFDKGVFPKTRVRVNPVTPVAAVGLGQVSFCAAHLEGRTRVHV